MGQTQNSCGFKQVYSLCLNTLDRDLAGNHHEPVRTLEVGNRKLGTMTSHSHHTNSTGGGSGITSKMTKQNGRGCLSTAVLPRGCGNITIYYNYNKHYQNVWLLWGGKVLIIEIGLKMYATKMLNSNRK